MNRAQGPRRLQILSTADLSASRLVWLLIAVVRKSCVPAIEDHVDTSICRLLNQSLRPVQGISADHWPHVSAVKPPCTNLTVTNISIAVELMKRLGTCHTSPFVKTWYLLGCSSRDRDKNTIRWTRRELDAIVYAVIQRRKRNHAWYSSFSNVNRQQHTFGRLKYKSLVPCSHKKGTKSMFSCLAVRMGILPRLSHVHR